MSAAAAGTKRRVLVIEDEPDSTEVNVALLDIGLPGLHGYELAREIRRRFPALLIIAVTGYGQREDRERAREAGFDAHLTKPFSYEELMHATAAVHRRNPPPRGLTAVTISPQAPGCSRP